MPVSKNKRKDETIHTTRGLVRAKGSRVTAQEAADRKARNVAQLDNDRQRALRKLTNWQFNQLGKICNGEFWRLKLEEIQSASQINRNTK